MRYKCRKVSQLLEVQFWVSSIWGIDFCGAFSQDYHWSGRNQYRTANITGLENPPGAHCCLPHVENLLDARSPMAAQVFFNGSLLGGISCTSTPSSLSVPRSSLTLPVPTSLRKSLYSMVSWKDLLSRHRSFKRGMRSSALADSDFSVKKDEMQTQSMFPAARRGKENAVSTTTVNATSVLPERKIIHETAVVHPDAFIGEGVVISAFCTVGPGVSIGNGCKLHPSSHVCGNTELGEGCEIMNGAVVGSDLPGRTVIGNHNTIGYHAVVGVKAQDLKYKEGDECFLHIGNNNDIREYVSIHRSSKPNDCTVIGDHNLFMATSHVAHDCKLGNHNILANGTLVGGHVIIGDYIHTGGAVGIHQFCHIDSYSFLAAGAMVTRDVPMYIMVSGNRAELRGLNLEGMRRLGFSDLEIKSIRRAYQKLFMNRDVGAGGLEDRLADLEANEDLANVPAAVALLRSVRNCLGENRRGICTYRLWNSGS
ncbi:probable acyl-[acyl-carrier-protein]--UDP-N-acetylglucosamine O-acyltransferase, mitochondrial isoform X2 [Physcomitrium patens]|uniref:UDP N-acetylglucosamine O-acyltransferase C-terminal domain-containing protein n=1 Tax=Physcomitrium patens TaxID=3218 RepID=A0A7I4DR69_PHYPA|nr:probable acyl-[acyl-carrier-protein]--UDP-N-acetylglucosamine O-acyltransferase, mitochondrial isoform X2 [Physcomitrium patens]|eukprot:XP_024376213.1 probable acyl-[acyl-carrier-protein]--UDP-N-acetylglucosamine O-acyltransferase, mitochondrial isoform X2 [Physcomitrella patens]